MTVNVEIEVDDDEAQRILKDLPDDIEDSADNAAQNIAERGARAARAELSRQGAVGTGQGIRSIQARKTGANEYSVLGKRYLIFRDRGTRPHRPPINKRLALWAERQGMNPSDLAQAIEERGTMPRPWIRKAFNKIITSSDKYAKAHIRKTRGVT